MKEDYLHFLWRMRFLPSRSFILTNGSAMEILEFGEYNKNESGPDFFHAKILIDDVLWFGHVEFHLKSSDWYKHHHQFDTAYDHVVLHVVWDMDQEVICQGKPLPTLLLSDYVKKDYSVSHKKGENNNQFLPCSFGLEEIDQIYIEREKEKSISERLQRKTVHFHQNPDEGYAQILYELIATAFGAKVNKDPFWQLTKELTVVRLLKMHQKKRAHALMMTSGLYTDLGRNMPIGIKPLEEFQWKKKGLRPNGAPEIRVKQFSMFIEHFNFDFGFLDLPPKVLLNYIRQSFSLVEEVNYTKAFQDLIVINSFVPFLWWLGEKRGNEIWQNKAIELLQLLPKETSSLTKFLQKAGLNMNSAYDSQALLELYVKKCSRKKCLTCTVGNKILGR